LEHQLEYVAVDRLLDPSGRDASSLGDLHDLTRLVLGESLRHLPQAIDRDAGPSVGGPMDRAEHLIRGLVLSHVAHGASSNHRRDRSRIRARRQGDDPGLGRTPTDLSSGSAPAATGHPNVQQRDVGFMELGEVDRLGRVARGSHDVYVSIRRDELAHRLEDRRLVVREHQSDASHAIS
jgi:hypothetical protein